MADEFGSRSGIIVGKWKYNEMSGEYEYCSSSCRVFQGRHECTLDDDVISFIEKTKGQLAANMSKKIQIKMIKQMQMARHKLTSYILYVSKNN